jgi:hypothetical protein
MTTPNRSKANAAPPLDDNQEEEEDQVLVPHGNVASPARHHGGDLPHTKTNTNTTTTSNPTNDYSPMTLPELWKTLDRELRTNIGNSVRCGICLCTVVDPVMTPCVHSFCRTCIHQWLYSHSKKCPECSQSITKRACQDYPYLKELADGYKQQLLEFAFLPSVVDPTFTTLTQALPSSSGSSTCSAATKPPPLSLETCTDRLQVAQTWQGVLNPSSTSPSSSSSSNHNNKEQPLLKVEPIFQSENAKVVRANQKAMQQATANTNNDPGGGGTQPPSTQECMEQCREQQMADQTWMEEDDEPPQQNESQNETPQPQPQNEELPEDYDEEATQPFGTAPEGEGTEASQGNATAMTMEFGTPAETTSQPGSSSPKPVLVKEATPEHRNVQATDADDDMTAPKLPPFAATESPILPATEECATSLLATTGPTSTTTTTTTPFHFDYGDDDDEIDDNDDDEDENEIEITNSENQRRVSFQKDAAPPIHNRDLTEPTPDSLLVPMPMPSPIPKESANVSTRRRPPKQKPTPKAKAPTTATAKRSRSRTPTSRPSIKAAKPLPNEDQAKEGSKPATALPKITAPPNRTTLSTATTIDASNNGNGNGNGNDKASITSIAKAQELPPPARTARASRPPPVETNQHLDSDDNDNDESDDETVQLLGPETQYQLATLHAEEQEQQEDHGSTSAPSLLLEIGMIVHVQARTWPGVNKPGGVARIQKSHADSQTYDVSYILGGKESQVDAVFVTQVPQEEEEVTDNNSGTTPSKRRSRISPREKPAALEGVATTTTSSARVPPPQLDPQVQAELPPELLAALAQEGFDTGVTAVPKKKRKPAAASTPAPLAKRRSREGTNNKSSTKNKNKNQMEATTKKAPATATATTKLAGKRKTATLSPGGKKVLQDSTNSKKSAGSSKLKKAETAAATTTTAATSRKKQKIATPKAVTPNSEANKTDEPKKRKSQPKNNKSTTLEVCLPKLSTEEMCEMADKHYGERFHSALADQVIHVVASNLMDQDMDVLRTLCCKTFPGDGTCTNHFGSLSDLVTNSLILLASSYSQLKSSSVKIVPKRRRFAS